MKKSSALSVVLVASTITFASSVFSQNGDCSSAWQAWSARPGQEGAFPDTNVSYFRYTFEVPQDRKIALRVSARYPLGRYMGFNIYNTAVMNSVAGIGDIEINPDPGFENPYRSGDISNEGRYTLIMDPHDPRISQNTDNDLISNSLTNEAVDPEAEKRKHYREVWYRIYDPSDGEGGLGQVELPKIEALDQATGDVVACPKTVDIPVPKGGFSWGRLSSAPPGADREGGLHLVHHQGMGLYANRDTSYLTARLKLVGARKQVVFLKFKAPKIAKSFEDFKNPSSFDVRYWSFCIGGAITTLTYDCIADRQAKVDADGFVRIVVAPESMRNEVKEGNFLVRPTGVLPVLIYRNLVSSENFEGAFSKIPLWGSRSSTPRSGAGEYAADRFIGDYAPVGRVCSVEEYLKDNCRL